jgi:hypothetical protein
MNETRQLAQQWFKLDTKTCRKSGEKAKELILDQLGAELACSTKPWSKIVVITPHRTSQQKVPLSIM